VAVSFIGGGNQSAWRKPPTRHIKLSVVWWGCWQWIWNQCKKNNQSGNNRIGISIFAYRG